MKSLQIIQVLSKIGKVLSKIAYIFFMVASIVSAVGMISLPFADKGIFKIGGVNIHMIIKYSGSDPNALYPFFPAMIIVCIGQTVIGRYAEKYFSNELTAGTPFTTDGANEMLKLGIKVLSISFITTLVAEISSGIIKSILECEDLFKLDIDSSLAIGVCFIIMSLLCKYGAELRQENEEKEKNSNGIVKVVEEINTNE